MHVVVIGCGRVGSNLAVALEQIGHDVAVLDRDATAFRRLGEGFGGTTVTGLALDADDLVAAGIEHADALAAVTSGDNSNIVAARMAREQFGVQRVVARIYDPMRAEVYQRMGIPTVATVSWATDQVLRRLVPDAIAHDWTDATGALAMFERELPRASAGLRLAEMSEAGAFTLVSVSRAGQAMLVTPDMKGQEGDVLHVVCRTDAVSRMVAALRGEDDADRAGTHA